MRVEMFVIDRCFYLVSKKELYDISDDANKQNEVETDKVVKRRADENILLQNLTGQNWMSLN